MPRISHGRIGELLRPYRIDDGRTFRLADHDPGHTARLEKRSAESLLREGIERLAALQDTLYAQDRWALLMVLQAMDAAGKDGTIKHVMTGVNPQGCQVYAFKQPSAEELDHDYLWRSARALPERGRIGIFNRSYYEEVLTVRVHPELLERQRLPPRCARGDVWKTRFHDIAAFERHLGRNGVVVRKFFLHVSRREQRERLLARLDDPTKRWKFSAADVAERAHWDDYMAAYEDAIRHTATPDAPWYVVPADHKWFARLVVAGALVHALEGLDLRYPELDDARLRELDEVRAALERETGDGRRPRAGRRHRAPD